MRVALFCLLLVLLVTTGSNAQQERRVEVGTRIGINALDGDGGHAFVAGAPGGGPSTGGALFGAGATVHIAMFPGHNLLSEAQLSALYLSSSGAETTRFGMIGFMGAYLFRGPEVSSPYAGINGAFGIIDAEDSGSTKDIAFGATLGYRFRVKEDVVIRLDGSYRRWIDLHVREFSLAAVLGFLP